jgi:hypothetical protein
MKAFLTFVTPILFLTLIIGTSQSQAFKLETDESGHVLHWSTNTFPVKYKITQSPPINADAFKHAIQLSFNTWQTVQNANISFQFVGITSKTVPAFDGENTIITGKDVTGNDVIGQSYIYYSTNDGSILDVDIVLSSSFKWSIDGAPDKMDVQNAATHEIGHFCGLDDLYGDEDRDKTMYGYIDYGETKKRTLAPDDKEGLITIYAFSPEPEDSGDGGSGCGTISPTHLPPGPRDINFLWLFLLLIFLLSHKVLGKGNKVLKD